MTYLSRIWLNPRRTGAQRLVANPRAAHAAVLAGIAEQPVNERVLWRLEPDRRTQHRLEMLVLTHSRPSWESLVEQAGWPQADDQSQVCSYQPLLDQIRLGREFAFQVKANPVSSTRNPVSPSVAQKERLAGARPRGVRVPERTAAHQLDWFIRRTEKWGFTLAVDPSGVAAVRLIGRGRLSFQKGPGTRVVLETATFEGILRVTDTNAMRAALLGGIGAGKAYGLGLLTLAPPFRADGAGGG